MFAAQVKSFLVLCGIALFCAFSFSTSALAQETVRPFPADVKVGVMNLAAGTAIEINGLARQLTAGAQIRNDKNHIVQPSSLQGGLVKILYKENGQKQIERIWILNSAEITLFAKGIPPSFLFSTPPSN